MVCGGSELARVFFCWHWEREREGNESKEWRRFFWKRGGGFLRKDDW